jgi:hypothetical protein
LIDRFSYFHSRLEISLGSKGGFQKATEILNNARTFVKEGRYSRPVSNFIDVTKMGEFMNEWKAEYIQCVENGTKVKEELEIPSSASPVYIEWRERSAFKPCQPKSLSLEVCILSSKKRIFFSTLFPLLRQLEIQLLFPFLN